ncbi:unnamed protein product [Rotaria magnacalcarata]|uniref:Splicing factor YJU2 n=1 Tax=Rotaria magnacalcarata TaxID=392030 RepID=A0A8S2KV32_9BILA|nr:unnamed protein product [Rotaria magnacalcarata]
MSERKVLNKYYPPDFDPSKLPRAKRSKNRQFTIRLMAPCNMRCKTCGEYIYKGKKFNARKEDVMGDSYLGIQIYRFYIKCTKCLREITFKTDPANGDYELEHGAMRNFESVRLAEKQAKEEAAKVLEEEALNPMKTTISFTQPFNAKKQSSKNALGMIIKKKSTTTEPISKPSAGLSSLLACYDDDDSS